MKILKNITTVLSVLTGVYILHTIILPAIFKEAYVKCILDISDWITNIAGSDSYSYRSHIIMIHVDDKGSVLHVLQIILPIIIFAALVILTVRLHIKIKKDKK